MTLTKNERLIWASAFSVSFNKSLDTISGLCLSSSAWDSIWNETSKQAVVRARDSVLFFRRLSKFSESDFDTETYLMLQSMLGE